MLRTKLKKIYFKKVVKIRHHGKLYFVNKDKLNYIFNRIGVCKKFDFVNVNLRDYLIKNKFLYTEFLNYVSDTVKTFDK